MTLKLLSSLTDSVSISVRLCLPSKSVCLQFCKVLSAFWMAWVQQDLTILTFMTFSLKEWSILITWIKNNSINIWMCFTLLVRYWLSSYDDQFQRLLAESIPILVVFFFFFPLASSSHPHPFCRMWENFDAHPSFLIRQYLDRITYSLNQTSQSQWKNSCGFSGIWMKLLRC